MDLLALFVAVCILSAGLNFAMGANDESMGSAYGSRALSLRTCLIVGGLAELAGSVLFGTEVATTIAGKLFSIKEFSVSEQPELMALVLSALIGATVFMIAASYFGLPVSSTHSIVGAVAVGAVTIKGVNVLNGREIGLIVASWFASPILSGLVVVGISKLIDVMVLNSADPYGRAQRTFSFWCFISLATVTLFVVFKGIPVDYRADALAGIVLACAFATAALIHVFVTPRLVDIVEARAKAAGGHRSNMWKTEQLFGCLQAVTATVFAFARGSNDASHGAGPFALAYQIYTNEGRAITSKATVELWALALGGLSMCLGLWLLGRNVVMAVGDNITQITPTRGVAVEVGTAITVLFFSTFGVPISSTHAIVGAIFFIGVAKMKGFIRPIEIEAVPEKPAAPVNVELSRVSNVDSATIAEPDSPTIDARIAVAEPESPPAESAGELEGPTMADVGWEPAPMPVASSALEPASDLGWAKVDIKSPAALVELQSPSSAHQLEIAVGVGKQQPDEPVHVEWKKVGRMAASWLATIPLSGGLTAFILALMIHV